MLFLKAVYLRDALLGDVTRKNSETAVGGGDCRECEEILYFW